MTTETLDRTSPEGIAQIILDAIHNRRVASWRELPSYLMRECDLAETDALAISEAVSRRWQERFLPAVTRLELFITENCNLRCDYCFVHGKNAFHRMSWDTAKKAVDFLIRESRDQKQLHIFYMGGEPFLEFELMRQVTLYAEERARETGKQVDFSVTTNGTLFTEESLAFCRDHAIRYMLSMDGDRETQNTHRKAPGGRGSFDLVLPWIPRMKHYQPWMGVRMTVHPDRAHALADDFDFLADQGINQFIIGPASGVEWTEEALATYRAQMIEVLRRYKARLDQGQQLRCDLFRDLDNLFDKKGIWGCQAGRHSLTIAANGDISPCPKMLGLNDLQGIYRLGDLEHGITDLDARMELVGMWGKRQTKCMTCDLADACTGGCFANNYEATGSIFIPCENDCKLLRVNLEIRQLARELLGTAASHPSGEECAV
ncbi:MAG: SPASM domain-containing protein [Chloroflexi bacterium]|nr:SPASM domain-containing protein [Chloroflexota bacterium]